jgi:hydroxymethylpyrimidine pyrophosphatase-like HAD family hydrolase
LGVYVILASEATPTMTAYAKELQMDTFMISYNGAVVTDLKKIKSFFELKP